MRINAVYASRDPHRAGVLIEALTAGGVSVSNALKAKEALGLLAHHSCELLLLGQKLVDEDGLALLKNIRSKGPSRQIPVVALIDQGESAQIPSPASFAAAAQAPSAGQRTIDTLKRFVKDSSGQAHIPARRSPSSQGPVSARLAFFQAGADECLSLNWDVAENVARIKAVLRRMSVNPAEEVIKMGAVELNITSYTLKVSGKRVPLTSKELDLLYVFLSSGNRVLSRPYLIERVWGYNYFGSPRTVDVHVRRLREKLGKAARYITTIPCVGYKLVPPNAEMRR